jgi:hypothetical protein
MCECYSKSAHMSVSLSRHSAIRDIVLVADNFVSNVISGMHVAVLKELPGRRASLLVRACRYQLVHLLFVTHATLHSPYPSITLRLSVCRSPNSPAKTIALLRGFVLMNDKVWEQTV